MQKVKLPLTIDPIKDAQRRMDYNGVLSKQLFSRLGGAVSNVLSDAQVSLSLFIDPQKLVVIKGNAIIDVEFECQRCGKLFMQALNCTFCFSPVSNMDDMDQVTQLPAIYEPVELNEFGEVNLVEAIEDEFILALPLVPMHNLEHCEVSVAEQVFGELPQDLAKKPNPFAVLAHLKQK